MFFQFDQIFQSNNKTSSALRIKNFFMLKASSCLSTIMIYIYLIFSLFILGRPQSEINIKKK